MATRVPDLIKRIALTAGKIILFLIVWGTLYAPFVVIRGGSRVTIELAGAVTVLIAAWISRAGSTNGLMTGGLLGPRAG